jgi:hypothetical protein
VTTTPKILCIWVIAMSLASCGNIDAAPQEHTDSGAIATESSARQASSPVTSASDDQTIEDARLADEMTDPDADQPVVAEEERPESNDGQDDVRTFSDETADEVTFAPQPSTSLPATAEDEEFRQRVSRHNERVRSRQAAAAEPPAN